jgi:hypothetical protein
VAYHVKQEFIKLRGQCGDVGGGEVGIGVGISMFGGDTDSDTDADADSELPFSAPSRERRVPRRGAEAQRKDPL